MANLAWDDIKLPNPVFAGRHAVVRVRGAGAARVGLAALRRHRRDPLARHQSAQGGRDRVPAQDDGLQARTPSRCRISSRSPTRNGASDRRRRQGALRERLAQPEILVVPGAFDALTGRLLERAGFEALYRGGYAASAAAFGLPDLGITSSTEMVDHARRLCSAVSLPVIADADTGLRRGRAGDPHRARAGARRRGRHPARGSGLPEALRPYGGQGRDRARSCTSRSCAPRWTRAPTPAR